MTKKSEHSFITYAVVALFFGVATCVVMFKVPAILTEVMDIIECDASEASMFMTIFSLVSCILAIPTAFLLKKLGPLQISIIGSIFAVVGTTLGAFSILGEGYVDYYLLVTSRALEGISYVFTSMCVPIVLKNAVPKNRRGFCLSIFSLFIPIGSVAGATFSPMLLSAVGFSVTWILYGVVMCIATLLLFFIFKDIKTVKEADDGLRRNPASPASIALFMVSFMLFCLMQIAILNYFPICLQLRFGMDSSLAGFLATLPSLIAVPFSILCGSLSDKHGTYKYVYIVTMIIFTPAVAMIFAFDGALFFVGYALVCIGLAAPAVNTVAVFELFRSRNSGIGMAVLIGISCLGQSVGNIVVSALLGNDFTGWIPASIFLLVCGVAACVCVAFARSKRSLKQDKK